MATTAAGQNASLTFQATAGQRIQAQTTEAAFPGGSVKWNLFRPDGSQVLQPFWQTDNAFVDTLKLNQTGTWLVKFDPTGTSSGSVKFRAWTVPPDLSGTYVLDDPAKTVTTTAAGQNASLTFQATAGQRIQAQTTEAAFPGGSVKWNLFRPDGSQVLQPFWQTDNAFVDTLTLNQTGTWQAARRSPCGMGPTLA